MRTEDKIMILKGRLKTIISRGKSEKFPGVRRKLERQICKLEAINK